MNNTAKFFLSIAIPLAVGFTSSLFTITGTGSWYQEISKPTWNPPNWIFGPVWTTLYVLMGIALYLVWKDDRVSRIKDTALLLFVFQLIFNFSWSYIFFDRHQIGLAFAEILILLALIILTIISFSRVNKLAAWLLVPYVSWVSFAAILNYTIWQMNK